MIAVEIRAKPLDCNSRRYEVTLIGYVNTASLVLFGGEEDVLSFGDGGSVIVPEQTPVVIDPLLNIGRVQYTIVHTYPRRASTLFPTENTQEMPVSSIWTSRRLQRSTQKPVLQ